MEIYYQNSKGEKVYFDRMPYYLLSETTLFDYEWQYETKRNNSVKNVKKTTRTATLNLLVKGKTKEECEQSATKLYEVLDYDCVIGEPGKLYCGKYFLQCYFVKSEKSEEYEASKQLTYTVVTDLVNWVKETITRYRNRRVTGTDVEGLDYPYNYEHNFMSAGQTVNNTSFYPSDFILTIYGPCQSPMITIGEHIYMVYSELEEGEYLLIDSRNRKITKVEKDGTRVTEFKNRSKDYYVFEKINPGLNPVYWEGNYDFDISILDERGEPKWT